MRRAAVLVLVLALPACGSSGGEGGGDPPRRAQLSRCAMTVDVFRAPEARVGALVPGRYRLAADRNGEAAVDVWTIACRRARIGGRDRGPVAMSLVGAVVGDPRRSGPRRAVYPAQFHHYLLWAHVDDDAAAGDLRRASLPAEAVPGLRHARGHVAVPWKTAPYDLVTPPLTGDDEPHDHDNAWWRDTPDGRTAQLSLRARDADDVNCERPPCTTLTVKAGTPLATLLGATSVVAEQSFDHIPLDLRLAFAPPTCLRFARDARAGGPPCAR